MPANAASSRTIPCVSLREGNANTSLESLVRRPVRFTTVHLGRRCVTWTVTVRDVGLVTVPRCDGAAMTTQMSWRRVGLFLGAAVATLLFLRILRLGEARIGAVSLSGPSR